MKRLCAVIFSFLLLACSSLPTALESPKVDLQNVDLSQAINENASLTFHFLVSNPNPVPLDVQKVDYALKINGRPLTNGVLDQGLKVGAHQSAVVALPVQVRYSDLVTSVSQLLQQGSSKYEINGSVKMGLFSIPFQNDGEFKLSDFAR